MMTLALVFSALRPRLAPQSWASIAASNYEQRSVRLEQTDHWIRIII